MRLHTPALRPALHRAQAPLAALASAGMFFLALMLVTNCAAPVVVVLSGSMEPGIHRGDLLLLTNYTRALAPGEIAVYRVPGDPAAQSIVHRVLRSEIDLSGTDGSGAMQRQRILTKGDNNDADDLVLYRGRERLARADVVGTVIGILPRVGYVSISFNEWPRLRAAVFGVLTLWGVISGRS